ncbi:MAG TPA: hypothetical protein VHC69_11065 [Polyangiaceae bacterium]|nr:hypothetical protein [Polyangiaceae bacterium]
MGAARRATARDRLMIEVDRDAAARLDARATERLIELETADVEVPPPPASAVAPPLYFRILAPSQTSLRVELWELGQPYGARSVSAVGSANLKARRIALAAAELARRLRQRRLAEIAERERALSSDEAARAKHGGFPIYGRLTWSAGLRGAAAGVSSAWLLGPAIDGTLRFGSGPRLSLGAAWLAGEARVFSPSASARFLQADLSCVQGFAVSPELTITAGLAAAVAAVRIGEPRGPSSAAFDTWSSHADLVARAEARLSRTVSLAIGPDIGVILTPVSTTGSDGEVHRISGLWLGGALTLTLDPDAP